MGLVAKFLRLPWRRKRLWLEAVFWLAVSRYRVWRVPFQQWSDWLGQHMHQGHATSLDGARQRLVDDVAWAVANASRHVPWQAVCLPQAMAAKAMLRRRGIASVLYVGMRKGEEKPYEAHAWLKVGDRAVTGGEGSEFTAVSHFG